MRIAIVYDNGEIGSHFGHADCIAVYEYDNNDFSKCTKTLLDTTEINGHNDMVDVMLEEKVDVLMAQTMGEAAVASLLSKGIVPIHGYCGDADTAADMIITGQLPLTPAETGNCGDGCGGGCGGGCSSCGGGCGCH